MKILQFVCDGNPGGGTNHVLQLLRAQEKDASNFLLTQGESYLAHQATDGATEVFEGDFFRSRMDTSAVARIREICNRLQPDLVHCHGGRAAFFASFANIPAPTIYTVHGFHHDRKPLPGRIAGWGAEFRTIRRMDHVLFVSDFDRRLAVRQKLLAANKPHSVIHNGINPISQREHSDRIGVGFLGRMVTQKNPQLFLDIAQQVPQANFVMAGGGDLEPLIKQEVTQRGLSDRLELFGTLDHSAALKFLSRLDVLVMTSRWEGLPLLLLEAMFVGVPIVTTAAGGVPEVIRHQETGFVSPSHDPTEMAGYVSSLLADRRLRSRITSQARRVAVRDFSQQTMLAKIFHVYRAALNTQVREPVPV